MKNILLGVSIGILATTLGLVLVSKYSKSQITIAQEMNTQLLDIIQCCAACEETSPHLDAYHDCRSVCVECVIKCNMDHNCAQSCPTSNDLFGTRR